MKNLYKIILGIIATGTVATTSAMITTKVVENKENEMAEKQNNNIITENILEDKKENEIENKTEEENTINEVVENNQTTVNVPTNYDNQQIVNSNNIESNNTSYRDEHQKVMEEYFKAKQKLWDEGKIPALDPKEFEKDYYSNTINQINSEQQQTQSIPEQSTTENIEQ